MSNHSIKINRAAKIALSGRYPRTWAALIAAIPAEVIAACTSRQLAQVADAMRMQHLIGHSAGYRDAQ